MRRPALSTASSGPFQVIRVRPSSGRGTMAVTRRKLQRPESASKSAASGSPRCAPTISSASPGRQRRGPSRRARRRSRPPAGRMRRARPPAAGGSRATRASQLGERLEDLGGLVGPGLALHAGAERALSSSAHRGRGARRIVHQRARGRSRRRRPDAGCSRSAGELADREAFARRAEIGLVGMALLVEGEDIAAAAQASISAIEKSSSSRVCRPRQRGHGGGGQAGEHRRP